MHSYVTRNPLYAIVFTKLGFAVVSVIKMIRFFSSVVRFCCVKIDMKMLSVTLNMELYAASCFFRNAHTEVSSPHTWHCQFVSIQKRVRLIHTCQFTQAVTTDVIPVFFYLANEMSGFHVCWQLSNMQKWSISKNRDFHFHFWIITGNYKIVAGKWKMELTMLLCLEIEQLF